MSHRSIFCFFYKSQFCRARLKHVVVHVCSYWSFVCLMVSVLSEIGLPLVDWDHLTRHVTSMTLRLHVELYHCSTEETIFSLAPGFCWPRDPWCERHFVVSTMLCTRCIQLFVTSLCCHWRSYCYQLHSPKRSGYHLDSYYSLTCNWFIEHTSIHTYGAF